MEIFDICPSSRPSSQYRLDFDTPATRVSCRALPCLPRNWFQCFSGLPDYAIARHVVSHFLFLSPSNFDLWSSHSRHIVTKYLSGDGNYRLVHEMNGNKDPDDIALTNGNSYFVRWADFEVYLKIASLKPEEVHVFVTFRYSLLTTCRIRK